MVGSSSTTQNVVAPSSSVSGCHGLVKTCKRLLGLQALASDFGRARSAQVFADRTACKGRASGRGVGKFRRLHVQVLWVQTAVREHECLRLSGLRLEVYGLRAGR